MSAAKLDEKHLKILRGLVQQPENKRCADCLAKGPVYANTTFHTFICTTCSGIHREFGFRVKSLSMASFKPEEVKALQEGGNEVAHRKWMSRWSSNEFPEPEAGDLDRVRTMIRMKYVEKRWASDEGRKPAASSSSSYSKKPSENDLPRTEPLTNVLGNNIPPLKVESSQRQSAPSNQSQQPQQSQAPPQKVVDFGAFDFQNQNQAPRPSNQQPSSPFGTQPIQPQQQNQGFGDLIFPSQEEVLKRQQEEQQKQKTLQLQQALGQMYQQTAYQQQQMAMQQMYLQQQYMMQQQMMQQQQMQSQQQVPQQGNQMYPGVVPQQNTQMYVQPQNGNGWATPQTQIPVEPEKPSKPDPFAALSPFSMSASSKNATPMVTAKPPPSTANDMDEFFGGVSSTPAPVQSNQQVNNDPFGFGSSVSVSSTQPASNGNFNPFM